MCVYKLNYMCVSLTLILRQLACKHTYVSLWCVDKSGQNGGVQNMKLYL